MVLCILGTVREGHHNIQVGVRKIEIVNLLLVIVCVFVVLSSRIVLSCVAVAKVYVVLLLVAVWVVDLVMKKKV